MGKYILSILSWLAILTMFGYIGYGLAKQFDTLTPPELYMHINTPAYTNQAYENLIYEHYINKERLNECESVIEDILRVGP